MYEKKFNEAKLPACEPVNGFIIASKLNEWAMKKHSHESVLRTDSKTSLYFTKDANKWVPLPAWGNFFIDIGRSVVENGNDQNRLVVALAVPTRTYAAAFAAFGVVFGRAVSSNKIIHEDVFDHLCKLRKGARVFYKKNTNTNEWSSAIYDGVCNDYDQPRIRIRVKQEIKSKKKEEPDTTYLICRKDSYKVRLADEKSKLTLKQRNSSQPIIIKKFLEGCLSEADALKLSTITQLDCVILGRVSNLREESTKIPFACSSNKSSLKEGVLQDILRVQTFFTSEDQPYRSEVLPVTGYKQPRIIDELVPHVTIFDGATGFIKWHDFYRHSHSIILLERTETRFREAVDIINQDYNHRICEGGIKNTAPTPPGVELVIYQKSCQ